MVVPLTEDYAPVESVLAVSTSVFVPVIERRMRAKDPPIPNAKIFDRYGCWFAVVAWPDERWLMLPLYMDPRC